MTEQHRLKNMKIFDTAITNEQDNMREKTIKYYILLVTINL